MPVCYAGCRLLSVIILNVVMTGAAAPGIEWKCNNYFTITHNRINSKIGSSLDESLRRGYGWKRWQVEREREKRESTKWRREKWDEWENGEDRERLNEWRRDNECEREIGLEKDIVNGKERDGFSEKKMWLRMVWKWRRKEVKERTKELQRDSGNREEKTDQNIMIEN